MSTRTSDDNNNGGGFLMGLVAGSALGAGVAFYFLAPRLVSEFRERVTDSAAGLRDVATEGVHAVATSVADVVDRVADTVDGVATTGQTVRDGVVDAVARGAHEVGRGAREIVRSARDVEQFATASKTDAKTAKA